MIVRVPSAAAHVALVVLSIALASTLAFSSIRNARAVHNSGLLTLKGYKAAVRLEPSDPRNWYLLGRYLQYNLEDSDIARAIQSYRVSLTLDPRAASTWLDLAGAFESEGDNRDAGDAYRQASRVYPLSAEVSWRYANFLLRQDQLPEAFALMRQSVSVDPQRAAQAFSRSWRVDPDIHAILNQALPPIPSVYLDSIRELVASRDVGAALVVWDRLVTLQPRPHLKLQDAFALTGMLLESQQPADARRVWNEAVTLSNLPAALDPPGSLLWDGGFETAERNGGFAWSFGTPSAGVRTQLDRSVKHSGKQALRLTFDGRQNVNFEDVCQAVSVQAGTRYLFSAWVQTQDLVTTQGVRFRLLWLENSQLRSIETPELHGTQSWTQITLPWTAARDVHQVRICIARKPSDDFNSRIQGSAWIDDVSLTAASGEHHQP
jgi:tetratricopeptide (TPR) repeat protein